MRVGLLPMGAVPHEVLGGLSDRLAAHGIVGTILADAPTPAEARLGDHRQLDADAILKGMAAKSSESVILAVTAEDLASGAFDFVFGLADGAGRVAVVSTYRLRGGPVPLIDRLVKEALHELGHVLGLSHCSNGRCVMHFSASLADTDAKGEEFCERCRPRVPIAARASP